MLPIRVLLAVVPLCLLVSGQRTNNGNLRRPLRAVGKPPPSVTAAPLRGRAVVPQRDVNIAPNHPLYQQYGRYHPLPFHMPASGEPHLKLLDVLYAKDRLNPALPPMKTLNEIPNFDMDLIKRHFGGAVPWARAQLTTTDVGLTNAQLQRMENAPPKYPDFYVQEAQRGSTSRMTSIPAAPVVQAPTRIAGNPQKREASLSRRATGNNPAVVAAMMDADLKKYAQDSGEVFKLTPREVQAAVAKVERMVPTYGQKDFFFDRYNPLPALGDNDGSVLYIRGPLIKTPARDLMFEDSVHLENSNRVGHPNEMANEFFWVPSKGSGQFRQMLKPKANILQYKQ